MSFNLMGFIKGASEGFVESRQRRAESVQKLIEEENKFTAEILGRQAKSSGDLSFHMRPTEIDSLDMGMDEKQARLRERESPTGFAISVPRITKDNFGSGINQLLGLRGPQNQVLGATLTAEHYNTKPSISQMRTKERYDGAVTDAFRIAFRQMGREEGGTGTAKNLRFAPIISLIPDFDAMPQESKNYLVEKMAEAANVSVDDAIRRGLVPRGSYAVRKPSGEIDIEDGSVQLNTGKTLNVADVSPDMQSKFFTHTQTRNLFAEDIGDTEGGARRMMKRFLPYEEMGISMGYMYNAVTNTSKMFDDGTIRVTSNGTAIIDPAAMKQFRQGTQDLFDIGEAGFTGVSLVVQGSMRNRDSYVKSGVSVGRTAESQKEEDLQSFYKNATGVDQKYFAQKSRELGQLRSTIGALQEVLTVSKTGLARKGTLFVQGVKDTINQLGLDPDSPELKVITDKLAIFERSETDAAADDHAEAIQTYLINELAYLVARSLESSTGNARLAAEDVRRSATSLGLEGMFVSRGNAQAVLAVLDARASRELEYVNIMKAGDIPQMQAAMVTAQVYGTDSMLRTVGFGMGTNGTRTTLKNFMSAIHTEAGINLADGTPDTDDTVDTFDE